MVELRIMGFGLRDFRSVVGLVMYGLGAHLNYNLKTWYLPNSAYKNPL